MFEHKLLFVCFPSHFSMRYYTPNLSFALISVMLLDANILAMLCDLKDNELNFV